MLNDTSLLNPQGRVKLELYNEEGVFFTKEKKNLVVTSANEIVANMMSDPAKTSRYTEVNEGNSERTPNGEGHFNFPLSVQSHVLKTTTHDVLSTNENTDFNIDELRDIEEILSIKVGEDELIIDQDVFLFDAETGTLHFEEAPKELIEVKFLAVNDKQVAIIAGTERVTVNGEEWMRGLKPSNSDKVYAFNHKTGKLAFEQITSDIKVQYDCLKHYGLGFMGLGGKPEGHPDHRPVSFSNVDKALTRMSQEFENARMPIIYPAATEEGKAELEVLPTKPVATEQKEETITVVTKGFEEEVEKIYKLDDSGKRLLKIISAEKIVSGSEDNEVLVVGEDITINDAAAATVEIQKELEKDDQVKVVFQMQQNNLHLNYQLAMTPVVELVSVVHEDAVTNQVTAYEIQDRGMRIGSGDVWMMNPNAGILQFSSNPSNGIPVHTPGQITIQYRVNAGKVVKFVADFPKGVPGPIKLDQTDTFTSTGDTTFVLSHVVAKGTDSQFEVDKVTRNGKEETFNVHADGTRIDIDNVVAGDIIVVTYKYLEDAHEVYQVAMFDEKDTANSKMFNISGIGPVRKDKDTGMRITWSVTF